MLIIGLMSGTSCDGIDAALVEIRGSGRRTSIRPIAFECFAYDAPFRAALLTLAHPKAGSVPDLCVADSAIAERLTSAALSVAQRADIAMSGIDAVASHGHTVWHQPEARSFAGRLQRGTLQIGCPSTISAITGCKAISDFRTADMAVGGQGAPLVTYADWALLTSRREPRAVLNLGGIANITYLPRAARVDQVIAFDTGPANMAIDGLVRRLSGGTKQHDERGAWAASGRVCAGLLEAMLRDAYFAKPPPKTTGREEFGDAFVEKTIRWGRRYELSERDLVATATALTTESIARAYREWIVPRGGAKTVVVGGGGTHNATLMAMLADRLAPARIASHAEFGIPDDAKEAISFALLGYETLHGRPSNVPSATGASRPVVLGSITRV